MIRIIRLLGAALGAFIGLGLATASGLFQETGSSYGLILAAWTVAWLIVGFAILPYLTIVPATWIVRSVQELSTAEFVTAVVGLIIGLLMGLLLGAPLSNFPDPLGRWLPLATSIGFGLGMVGLTVAKRQDLIVAAEAIGVFRRPEAADEAAARKGDPHIIVDTSAIIDGRIAEIVGVGLHLRDAGRSRASSSRSSSTSPTARTRSAATAAGAASRSWPRCRRTRRRRSRSSRTRSATCSEVDAKLVALAKRYSGAILTNDFNLNRVAELQGLRVLNINSLANAVKPAVLPGEELHVKVIQDGKEAGQGVGFLDDGTMIVVEGGARFIDRELEVTVTRVLQTVAGRMVFAQPRTE